LRAFIGVMIYGLCGALTLSMTWCLRPIVRLRAAGRSSRRAVGTWADGLACTGLPCSTSLLLLAGRRWSSWSIGELRGRLLVFKNIVFEYFYYQK